MTRETRMGQPSYTEFRILPALKYFNQSGFDVRRRLSPALPASTDLLLTALGVVWFFSNAWHGNLASLNRTKPH